MAVGTNVTLLLVKGKRTQSRKFSLCTAVQPLLNVVSNFHAVKVDGESSRNDLQLGKHVLQ